MSEINTKDDIDPVLNKYLKNRMINKENLNTIKIQITSILKNVEIAHLFKPNLKIFSEFSILSKNGIFRPDRVIIHSIDNNPLIYSGCIHIIYLILSSIFNHKVLIWVGGIKSICIILWHP